MRNIGFLCRVFLLTGALLLPHAAVQADGGTLRLSERKQDYQISVFTSPTPLRCGPIDVSVLVQDVVSGEPIPQARVLVRATPHGHAEGEFSHLATSEAATNKLFQAAVFDLPEPGLWDIEIIIEAPRGLVEVHFEMEAEQSLPHFGEMWPWIAWPAGIIVLFGVHQWRVRKEDARRGNALRGGNSPKVALPDTSCGRAVAAAGGESDAARP